MLSFLNNITVRSGYCRILKQLGCLSLFFVTGFFPIAAIAGDDISTSNASNASHASNAINNKTGDELDSPIHKTREELFLEVFKRPALDIPVNSYVVVVFNGSVEKKVKMVMSQDEQSMMLEGKPLIDVFSQQLLLPDILHKLEQNIDADGWLNRAALEDAGISTLFHPSKFKLLVTMPPTMRTKQVRYLSAPMLDPFTVDSIRPVQVSAFINFDLKTLVASTKKSDTTGNKLQTGVAANGAINLMGVVVEGAAFSQIGDTNSLHRGDIRLVYDQPQQVLRYTLGDLDYPTIGYQSTLEIGGISFAKDFSLQPYVSTYREENLEFYLEQPATVEVWVNQSLVSTLQLPAGSHDIRGFTPALGQNDTRLVVEDASGQKEVLHFSYVFNPILLKKGRSQFSYNAGFSRQLKDEIYHYDLNKPVLSASYRLGISDETTLGLYVQADDLHSLIGANTIHALPTGTMQLDMAASRSASGKPGMGAKVAWSNIPKKSDSLGMRSQLSVEYLSKHFDLADTSSQTERDVINLNAALSFQIGKSVSAHIRGAFAPARNLGSAESHLVSAGLSRKWGKYTTISTALRRKRSSQQLMQTELVFGISSSFSNSLGDFYVAKEMETNTLASTWNSRGENAYQFGSASVGSDKVEYMGGVGYKGSQGLAELSHTGSQTNQDTGRLSESQSILHLQSTLVLANSTLALSQPVRNSFAIVKGKEGLAGVGMKIDPYGKNQSKAQSSWISPAVLVDMPNYQLQNITIEPINPPLGVTPEDMTFPLLSTYKSGFLLELGKERTIFAIGRLVDNQQVPLANMPIEIRRIDDLDNLEEKLVSTFTSRTGRFQMPEIKPGYYEIRPTSATQLGSVIVDIVETDKDIYRLGDLVVQP